jgi:hypothetical protein
MEKQMHDLKGIFIEDKYHSCYPKPRGGFTFEKIVKYIKNVGSPSTNCDLFTNIAPTAYKEIKKFSSAQELMDHIYWHGTGRYIDGGLKAGFNIVKKGHEGGDGYGELYHTISVSKDRKVASSFSGQQSYGTIHPVLLRKGAIIENLPEIEDSIEVEDILVDLWSKGVDSVKIGDWSSSHSEQELVVLNPKSILLFRGKSFQVFRVNRKQFENPDISVYQAIYDTVKNSNIRPTKDKPLMVSLKD